MPSVKTAISLDKELLMSVDRLASDLHISRSKVFALAVQNFLKIRENQSLLEQLNKAHEDFPDKEEKAISKAMCTKYGKIVEHESW